MPYARGPAAQILTVIRRSMDLPSQPRIAVAKVHQYGSGPIVLVGGDDYSVGLDDREWIISRPVVVKVLA